MRQKLRQALIRIVEHLDEEWGDYQACNKTERANHIGRDIECVRRALAEEDRKDARLAEYIAERQRQEEQFMAERAARGIL